MPKTFSLRAFAPGHEERLLPEAENQFRSGHSHPILQRVAAALQTASGSLFT
jgi:hypothetical protein